ncbi:hypothetical protein ACFX2I_029429 [Malus domestica]
MDALGHHHVKLTMANPNPYLFIINLVSSFTYQTSTNQNHELTYRHKMLSYIFITTKSCTASKKFDVSGTPTCNDNVAFGQSTSPMGVMADEDDVVIKTRTTEKAIF